MPLDRQLEQKMEKAIGVTFVMVLAPFFGVGFICYASLLADFIRCQSRKLSVGIRIRVPIRIVGNPGYELFLRCKI